MKTTNILLSILLFALMAACVPLTGEVAEQDQQTDEFRAALVSASDLEVRYGAGNDQRHQGLGGEYSALALVTADTVIGTTIFMSAHFTLMKAILLFPPTIVEEDRRVWEGEHEELLMRVEATRTFTDDGARYVYSMSGKHRTDLDGSMTTILEGDVTRIDGGPDGYGVVRFYFSNLNELEPHRQIEGTSRIAFRRANGVGQVNVIYNGIKNDDPQFPEEGAYRYVVLADGSGGLQWFSRSDLTRDGIASEYVAAHSIWRSDRSGVGQALAFGGGIEVDYWLMTECWQPNGMKAFGRLDVPNFHLESGSRAECVRSPDDLTVPAFVENVADEDPTIPGPHPAEVQADADIAAQAQADIAAGDEIEIQVEVEADAEVAAEGELGSE